MRNLLRLAFAWAVLLSLVQQPGLAQYTRTDLEGTAKLAADVSIPVIASGGVGSEEDVLRTAGYASRGIAGDGLRLPAS